MLGCGRQCLFSSTLFLVEIQSPWHMISVNPLTTQKFGRIITASQINPRHGKVNKLLSCTGRIWSCLSPGYITKHYKLGGLINRHLFLTGLEAGNPKSRCQQIGFLTWVYFLVPRYLSSNCVLTCLGERERVLVSLLLIRTLIPSWGPHPHDFIKLNCLPNAPPPSANPLGVTASIYKLRRETVHRRRCPHLLPSS